MNRQTIKDAISEATEFIDKAEAYLAHTDRTSPTYEGGTWPKESGALRRASMDLSRKLSDLRQGR
jgi:hypothetical protein